jgi:hypothetical protein
MNEKIFLEEKKKSKRLHMNSENREYADLPAVRCAD